MTKSIKTIFDIICNSITYILSYFLLSIYKEISKIYEKDGFRKNNIL